MPQNPERPQKGFGDYSELLSTESSVLRTLCLTINAAGSEMKYKIIDTLSEDDFYYPVNKSIFAALNDMHRRGDYVVFTNLEEELRNRAVDVPEDLFIEDFFRGELPELSEVAAWVKRLKERSRGSLSVPPAALAGQPEPSAPAASRPAAPGAEQATTHVRATAEVRPIVVKAEKVAPKAPPVRAEPPLAAEPAVRAESPVRAEPVGDRPLPSRGPLLSSEGDEWSGYLDELASKQGRSFETGFVGLDEKVGGLSTGLMLVVDPDRGRRSSFLKQLTDQIAARMGIPCLYISFEAAKAALRIATLSRLSGVPSRDIERGRLRKDSAEWESVERNGKKAAAWLKKVFVIEADVALGLAQVRDMARQLREPERPGLVVVDNLERLSASPGSPRGVVAELKGLSETLNVLVVAGALGEKLLSEPEVDFATVLSGEGGAVKLEVLRAGDPRSTSIPLSYQAGVHKFSEPTIS